MGGFPLGSKLEIELPRELLNMEVLSIIFCVSTTRIEMVGESIEMVVSAVDIPKRQVPVVQSRCSA